MKMQIHRFLNVKDIMCAVATSYALPTMVMCMMRRSTHGWKAVRLVNGLVLKYIFYLLYYFSFDLFGDVTSMYVYNLIFISPTT